MNRVLLYAYLEAIKDGAEWSRRPPERTDFAQSHGDAPKQKSRARIPVRCRTGMALEV